MRLLLASAVLALPLAACKAEAEATREPASQAAREEAPSDVIGLSVADVASRWNEGAIADGTLTLVDVRTRAEAAEGLIGGARIISLDDFDPEALADELAADYQGEVIFYCRSGRRSAIAARRWAEFTGEPARHMEGGFLAWQGAGQPVFVPYVIE